MRTPRTHRKAAALLAVCALALAAGCSSQGGKDSEEKNGDGGGGGKTVSTPRLKIAMVTHSGEGDTFWDIVQSGAKQAAAKDNVEFLYAADKEGKEQAQLIDSYVAKKVDGIVVTLAKPEAVKAAVEKAVAAGIPVVTINSGGEHSRAVGALSHIGQEESVAGEAVGEELNKRGKKKALCVIHEQGNVSLEARCAGLKKTFGGTVENLNVQGTDMPGSTSSIEAKLQTGKDIDTVVTLGAPFAAATVKARAGAGSDAEVNTFDLNAEVVRQLKAKEIGFAVDQQPYLQGYLAVDELWLHKTNGNVLGGGKPVLTGPALVTEKDVPALEKYTARGTR
ncbi:sugar ABC transporter substrate-binding protein [Streptomyces agglomeratus]|uniref:Sugar ABC transporter substrate-binding protein n=1 Tax=Streptomyces agglomeratus TaxID=285458 RepID=A0A1E5P461_9ACTN|nr:substrate-binding domain-containing protein [Streptomyces agglomeratus]OEJ24340.1 sugar ABC transporter substrate-binding protein [Streptomyces agglomeratus]OEJ41709.1 sugar ABC transporter substrate-binding protein [Streptomyces agglomeratus]OEJ43913.1 sugar ABC transporter substrate-binding protein [Streptomyces agglomeratus]OEJ54203.1 sugar ABC transporter substrate-binding protein [Streptomyces agglomeratus]OEJ61573.1 sugar ABC transporter substrate-binding protein [Streptomyces agglome